MAIMIGGLSRGLLLCSAVMAGEILAAHLNVNDSSDRLEIKYL